MVIVKKEDNGNKLQWYMQLCICHHHMLLTSSIITELDSVFDVSKKLKKEMQQGQEQLRKTTILLEIYSFSPRASGSTCPEGAISSLNTSLKNVTDTKIIIKE